MMLFFECLKAIPRKKDRVKYAIIWPKLRSNSLLAAFTAIEEAGERLK